MQSLAATLPPEPWFVDDDGVRFQYGNDHFRVDGEVPEDVYSRDSHPERFEPLHRAADRLVEGLVAAFDVSIDADVHQEAREAAAAGEVLRSVRLTPSDPLASPLTVTWTSYLLLTVAVGARVTLVVPQCGCDACDETAATALYALEEVVEAVTSGGVTEWTGAPPQHVVGFDRPGRRPRAGWGCAFQTETGQRSSHAIGDGRIHDATAARTLAELPDGRWRAWPVRR